MSGISAMCALHPTVAATRTCERCGNFMCQGCSEAGTHAKCPTCRELVGDGTFPYRRDSFSFDQLWSYALEKWTAEWVMLSVAVLVMFGASFAVSIFTNILQSILTAVLGAGRDGGEDALSAVFISVGLAQLIGLVLRMGVDGLFQMGLVRIAIDVLNGRKVDLARLVSQASKVPRYMAQALLALLAFGIPFTALYAVALLAGLSSSGMSLGELNSFRAWEQEFETLMPHLVVPFLAATAVAVPLLLYFGLPLAMTNMELVYGDASPIEVFRRCYVIAKGLRFPLLGYALVGGLVSLVGALACCIGILPAVGMTQLLMGSFYLAARQGTGLPPAPNP